MLLRGCCTEQYKFSTFFREIAFLFKNFWTQTYICVALCCCARSQGHRRGERCNTFSLLVRLTVNARDYHLLFLLSLLLQAVEVVFKFCIVSVVISLLATHIVLFYELFKRILLVYILFHNICIFNVCHIPFLSPPLPDDCCLAAVRHVCVCLRVQAQGVV